MRIPLAISASAHAAILVAGIVSLPSWRSLEAPPQESIPIEIVSIEEMTQVMQGGRDGEESDEGAVRETPRDDATREGADEDTQSEVEPAAPPPPQPRAEPPPPEPEPETAAEPEPEPEIAPEPEPDVAEPEPAPVPEPEVAEAEPAPAPEPSRPRIDPADVPSPRNRPTPPPPQRAEPPREEPDRLAEILRSEPEQPERQEEPNRQEQPERQDQPQSDFDADRIAALLDRSTPAPAAAAPDVVSETPAQGAMRGLDARLSVSEIDALRQQISRCWSPPVGATGADSLIVRLAIRLNVDGSLSSTPEVVNVTPGEFSQVAAESAVRAVARCQPYSLPPEKHDLWQHIVINFDPREMFGG